MNPTTGRITASAEVGARVITFGTANHYPVQTYIMQLRMLHNPQ